MVHLYTVLGRSEYRHKGSVNVWVTSKLKDVRCTYRRSFVHAIKDSRL